MLSEVITVLGWGSLTKNHIEAPSSVAEYRYKGRAYGDRI